MQKIKFLFLIELLIIPSFVYSLNWGSLIKNEYLEAKPGDSIVFEIMFWNTGDSEFIVSFEDYDVPNGWVVIYKNKTFTLFSSVNSTGPNYVHLPNQGYVKAENIDFIIKTTKDTKPGIYEVKIKALTQPSHQGISVIQERIFDFRVKILDEGSFLEKIKHKIPNSAQEDYSNIKERITGLVSKVYENAWPTTKIAIIFIFLVAIIVYKKLKK